MHLKYIHCTSSKGSLTSICMRERIGVDYRTSIDSGVSHWDMFYHAYISTLGDELAAAVDLGKMP